VRSLVRANSCLADKFHPGVWSGKWLCCGELSKQVPGCQLITWTPRSAKSEPAPPLPLSDPVTDLDDAPAAPERLVVVATIQRRRNTLVVVILSYMTWTPNLLRLAAVRSTRQQGEQRDVAVPVTASKRTLTELQRKDESQPKHHLIRPETSLVINLTRVNMR